METTDSTNPLFFFCNNIFYLRQPLPNFRANSETLRGQSLGSLSSPAPVLRSFSLLLLLTTWGTEPPSLPVSRPCQATRTSGERGTRIRTSPPCKTLPYPPHIFPGSSLRSASRALRRRNPPLTLCFEETPVRPCEAHARPGAGAPTAAGSGRHPPAAALTTPSFPSRPASAEQGPSFYPTHTAGRSLGPVPAA